MSHFLAVVLVSGSIGSYFYLEASKSILHHLQTRLMNSAGLISQMIDAQKLDGILSPEDMDSDAYLDVLSQLRAMRTSNHDIAFLYIMRRVGDQVAFVVDSDDTEEQALPGQVYPEQIESLMRGFNELSVDDEIYKDEWGAFLSGYAPLSNGNGNYLVGIDMRASEVQRKFHDLRLSGLISLMLSVLLALLFSRIMATHFNRSISLLVTKCQNIAQGHYGDRIEHHTNDELNDLIKSVNHLSATVKESIEERQAALDSLARINSELEDRVNSRTLELTEMNQKLRSQIDATNKARKVARQANDQLLQAHKYETVGSMAGGFAHDFNNLLAGIVGNADLALAFQHDQRELEACIRNVKESGMRARDLTNNLLLYAGKGDTTRQPCDINLLIAEIDHILRSAIPRHIVLQSVPGLNLPMVPLDSAQIRQAIMNLVINAGDSMGGNPGAITIRTGSVEATASFFGECYFKDDLKEGTYVYLEVEDDGCGIDNELLVRMFDPFFSTKQEGRGLGLAVVAGIVRTHHGAIKVRSQIGKGTCIAIFLPVEEISLPVVLRPVTAIPSTPSGHTILIVDDQHMILEMVRQMLKMYGYHVLCAASGREGMAIYRENQQVIGLLIQDWSMPDMTGETVIQYVRALSPDLPIIVASGYLAEDILLRLKDYNVSDYIQKPFEMKRLVEGVRRFVSAS